MEFGNDFVGNVLILDVDNISSSHAYNRKNNFLVLGEGQTERINNSTGAAEKKLVLTLAKQIKNFALSLHYNDDGSYLYVNKAEI